MKFENPERRIALYQKLFSGELGEKVLQDLWMHTDSNYYDPEPNKVYYKMGRKNLIEDIFKLVYVDPEEYRKQYIKFELAKESWMED